MLTLILTDDDIMRLKVINMDRDEQDALAFIREKIIPEIQKSDGMKMQSHLDGGKGSMF